MALVRILVDGYSLLHGWPDLAPGRPRHSAAARDELVRVLTLYRDACGTPVTVVFDAGNAPDHVPRSESSPDCEVLYSKSGQTADDVIERATHRLLEYGEVLVVTDDAVEQETVRALGGWAMDCDPFIRMIEDSLLELELDVKRHNSKERTRYLRST